MDERAALYSSSLYDLALEEGVSKEVYEGLKMMDSLFKENPDYIRVIDSVQIPSDERERLIDEAFEGNVHVFLLNYLKILAKIRSANIFAESFEEYEKRYFADQNIERARIITAFELSDEKKNDVVKRISAASGKTVLAKFETDKSIVGGIVIRTDTSAIDASVKTKLDNIKRYIGKN